MGVFLDAPPALTYPGAQQEVTWLGRICVDISKSRLERLYIKRGLSTRECAKIIGCARSTISVKLSEYGIKARTLSETKRGANHPNYGKFGADHPSYGYKHPMEIRRMLSDVNRGERNPRFGKPVSEEQRRKLRGENNPNWMGGASFEPYCHKFNESIKESVRDEFDRRCFLCGEPENGRRLSVHHVDYNKGQGCGHQWALIPLCSSCHSKTNFNRWYWFALLNNYWLDKYNIDWAGTA